MENGVSDFWIKKRNKAKCTKEKGLELWIGEQGLEIFCS